MARAVFQIQLKKVVGIALMLALLLVTQGVCAHRFGVRGSIYAIAEPDMLMGIQTTLQAMQNSGELARQNKAVLDRTMQHILRPKPVSGVTDLPAGVRPITRTFNPSIVLNKTIIDATGRVIARKGQRINPLDYINFHEVLVFVNGDNTSQMQWASRLIQKTQKTKKAQERHQTVKIILVNGNIKTVSDALKTPIYFDQQGRLCQHFNITHTPTFVFEPQHQQDRDKKLVVQEVQID